LSDIKRDIVAKRLARVAQEGFSLGHPVPAQREVPLVAFDRPPFVICEVKRRSPSRGEIQGDLDAVAQARRYVEAGVKTISVLTEEDYFSGSLQDLMDVKKAFPDVAVLRKDFLVRREDLDVAFRAGADAVLLIASLLSADELADLKTWGESLGLAVFVEVHDAADVAKARPLKPRFTGINCRNLGDFSIDRALPLKVRPLVDWTTRLVFESGISRLEEASWAGESGFQGVLVGEGAVRNPGLARELATGFRPPSVHHPSDDVSFWSRLYSRLRPGRPLVKICGLAHRQDAELAQELGADLLGFILAPSPRRVDAGFLRSLRAIRALKVGVVTMGPHEPVPDELVDLLDDGLLDALQFHGQETPALVDIWASRGYKAVRANSSAALGPFQKGIAPRILADAFVKDSEGRILTGGTGQRIPNDVLATLGSQTLWLAGGLGPENIAEVIHTWHPELIDASSSLEAVPGHKDPAKLKAYFQEIDHACL
jgi:indole-3-glycerol phosphate synthase/phosphoribosylanthranilate isomerase